MRLLVGRVHTVAMMREAKKESKEIRREDHMPLGEQEMHISFGKVKILTVERTMLPEMVASANKSRLAANFLVKVVQGRTGSLAPSSREYQARGADT